MKRKTSGKTVTMFGVTIPVHDYVTIGEYQDLKHLFFDQTDIVDVQRQLAAFAILARGRGHEDFTWEGISTSEPFPDDFDENMRELLVPFGDSWRKRARMEFDTQINLLGTPDLETAILRTEEALGTMRATLAERTGE